MTNQTAKLSTRGTKSAASSKHVVAYELQKPEAHIYNLGSLLVTSMPNTEARRAAAIVANTGTHIALPTAVTVSVKGWESSSMYHEGNP